MKKLIVAYLHLFAALALLVFWLYATVGATAKFDVRAKIVGEDTLLSITLPESDNIWLCVWFREVGGDPDYQPGICGAPRPESFTYTIPNWPPDGKWEYSGLLQWRDNPNQTENFPEASVPWTKLE